MSLAVDVLAERVEAGAACAGHDPRIWFPEDGDYETGARAVIICQGCPVRDDCLDLALLLREEHGVWGGLNPRGRARVARQRRRARSR